MNTIISLIFFELYILIMLISLSKYPQVFLAFAIVAIAINDFVFIPLSGAFSGPLYEVARSWRELSCAVAILIFLSPQKNREKVDNTFLIVAAAIAFMSLYGFALGIINGGNASTSYTGLRRACVPILLAYATYLSGIYRGIKPKVLFWAISGIAVVMTIYALYVYSLPASEYKSLWYYDFVAGQKLSTGIDERLTEYQFIRNGKLRSSGFFVSAIEYSLFCVVAFTVTAAAAVTGIRGIPRIVFAALSAFFAVGIYISQVRAGILSAVIALAAVSAFHIFKRLRPMPMLIIPIALAALSLIAVALKGSGLDASTTGRIPQYAAFTHEFRPTGYGFIPLVNNGPTFRDSWYLSTVMTFGLLTPIYWAAVLLPLNRIDGINRERMSREGGYLYPLCLAFMALMLVHAFNAAFHYSVGNAHLALIILMGTFVAFHMKLRNSTTPQRSEQRSRNMVSRAPSTPTNPA